MGALKELIDPIYIALHLVNFVVLAFFLRKLLYKPVKKIMTKRDELVAEQQRKLTEADADIQRKRQALEEEFTLRAEKLDSEHKAAMAAIGDKSELLLQKAQAEADEIRNVGRASVEREQQEAVANMDVTVAQLAVEIAGRLIEEQFSPEEHLMLIQKGIQEAKSIGK